MAVAAFGSSEYICRAKYMIATMRKYCFTLLAAAVAGAMLSAPEQAMAQTCRVKCGRTPSGAPAYKEVYEYDYVSEKPTFPGGDSRLVSFINGERQYPADAYRRGISGRVTCSFVVNSDGSVSDIHVLKGVEPSLNEEAVRIFSRMPSWTPGKIKGQPVPVRVIWPVPFRL